MFGNGPMTWELSRSTDLIRGGAGDVHALRGRWGNEPCLTSYRDFCCSDFGWNFGFRLYILVKVYEGRITYKKCLKNHKINSILEDLSKNKLLHRCNKENNIDCEIFICW